jgi:uncharacterized protein
MPILLEPPSPVARHAAKPAARRRSTESLLVYLLLGTCFGIALMKSEATSWFRIQEMMRFRSPHLFAVFASAVATTWLGIRLIKWYRPRTVTGAAIVLPPKVWGSGIRYVVGGTLFGAGWAVTGACPGPMYSLLGAGVGPLVIPLLGALAGAWTYGWLRPRLPH